MNKKIGTTSELIMIRTKIASAKYSIKQHKDFKDLVEMYKKELSELQEVLNEYRQDITFLKTNIKVSYKR